MKEMDLVERAVSMTLDLAVARAAMLTATVEAALHSSKPWTIEIGGLRLPTARVVTKDSVGFWATVPVVCFVEPPDKMFLYEGETLRRVKELVYPGAGGFTVSWTFDEVPAPETVIA